MCRKRAFLRLFYLEACTFLFRGVYNGAATLEWVKLSFLETTALLTLSIIFHRSKKFSILENINFSADFADTDFEKRKLIMPDPRMISNIIATAFALATGITAQDQLFDAWSHTRNLRENGACGDQNLAIAEHYLYARYYVAKEGHWGWTKMQALITGYNVTKKVGLEGLLPQTGVCQVTPFSKLDVAWSFQGADDGLDDYLNGSQTPQTLNAPQPPD